MAATARAITDDYESISSMMAHGILRWTSAKKQLAGVRHIVILDLSRNFGHHRVRKWHMCS
jgi:hypothetical protein